MPIIDPTGRKSPKIRLLFIAMYLMLAVLGVTMVYPFLITVTSSTSNALDYYRFAPITRSLWSREERFVRLLVPYYPESMRNAMEQFAFCFDGVPSTWSTWKAVGDDQHAGDKFAAHYLALLRDPVRWPQVQRAAADYAAFSRQYPITDCVCAYNDRQLAHFFHAHYLAVARQQLGAHAGDRAIEAKSLALLGDNWGVPIDSYYSIQSVKELQIPWDQPSYVPATDGRAVDFQRLRAAYLDGKLLPMGMQAATDYFAETRPLLLKTAWLDYLNSPPIQAMLGQPDGSTMSVETYNKLFGTAYTALAETPFPVPPTAPARLRALWERYVQQQFPRRLMEVRITPEVNTAYQAFLRLRFKDNLARCNSMLEMNAPTWSAILCPAQMPDKPEMQGEIWAEFIGDLPFSLKTVHCAESAYQQFLQQKYGTLPAVNAAYGWHLREWEQAEMPLAWAYLATFAANERPMYLSSLTENYAFVLDYLVHQGNAVPNTLILIVLTLVTALTVNPLAAYALSRFQMKQLPSIILFMLATMAFPAAVTMIPGFLLMRDLHMLNTYWALVLPGIANGMSIFLLKGFFDSLPPELYEAATLDGAPEWVVFFRITLPLTMPILAVIALNCFIAAYNSWDWALVVCQNPKMWTLAVWLFQFNTNWATQPWAVMASFVLTSLPVFLVFMLCQNIILRGIILPQMK